MAPSMALLSSLQLASALAGFGTKDEALHLLHHHALGGVGAHDAAEMVGTNDTGDNDTSVNATNSVPDDLYGQANDNTRYLFPNCRACQDGATKNCCDIYEETYIPSKMDKCSQYLPPAVFDKLGSIVGNEDFAAAVASWHRGVPCFDPENYPEGFACETMTTSSQNCWCDPCRPPNTYQVGNMFTDKDVLYCDRNTYVEKCYPASPIEYQFMCNPQFPGGVNDPFGGWTVVVSPPPKTSLNALNWDTTPEKLWTCLGDKSYWKSVAQPADENDNPTGNETAR